jgi:protein SCO1
MTCLGRLRPTRWRRQIARIGSAFWRGFAAFAVIAGANPVDAHSLKGLEDELYQREQFFQIVDRPAPEFTLQDADGRAWNLDGLKGKVVVLNFIYANCPDVCPLHSELIAKLQAMIDRTPMRDHVQFISITTDPARDTPEVLKEYGPAHGLDPGNWVFLTTPPGQPEDATRQLAERFGHKFTQAEDGEFVHGIVTHVIDRDGALRANFHGLKFDPVNLVLLVNALVNDVHKPGEAAVETGAAASTPRAASQIAGYPVPILPIALLLLAAAWLAGAIVFFRFRRKRTSS